MSDMLNKRFQHNEVWQVFSVWVKSQAMVKHFQTIFAFQLQATAADVQVTCLQVFKKPFNLQLPSDGFMIQNIQSSSDFAAEVRSSTEGQALEDQK